MFVCLPLTPVEKDESVSRSYLSELQNIRLRLGEAEQRLTRGIQTPPPSRLSSDSFDNSVQIAEQEVRAALHPHLLVARRNASPFKIELLLTQITGIMCFTKGFNAL